MKTILNSVQVTTPITKDTVIYHCYDSALVAVECFIKYEGVRSKEIFILEVLEEDAILNSASEENLTFIENEITLAELKEKALQE